MPSRYKRKPGSRRYADYSQEKLERCLNMVRSKQLSQRAAADQYQIPRSTIKNKLKNKHSNKPGRPTIFSEEEEQVFVAHIIALAEFGFPLLSIDLQFIIRDYLSSHGREVPQFKNNVPGLEWLRCFMHRHPELSQRFANNIKKVRAQVSEAVIEDFIDNLRPELENIPPENLYNYDETNLTDDPGKKKVICRRGTKYPEAIINSSKLSYSVMFCGNAAGNSIAPYIIYKSDHLWTTWTENGPPGARYNRTKSGWIDAITFEDWFLNHLFPILRRQEGRKVVIGDNLASHINPSVLKVCEENNIAFICLPPNATHILQPLDVAYFRPLKIKWRQALLNWKQSQEGRKLPTLPKDKFPGILKQALDSMTATKENIIAGFEKTGIYPIDKAIPINRLPRQNRILHLDLIADSFMQQLQQTRNPSSSQTTTARKRKLNVPAGRSITVQDIADSGPSDVTSKSVTKKTKNIKTQAQRRRQRHEDSTTSCSSNMSDVSSTADLPDDDFVPDDPEYEDENVPAGRSITVQDIADSGPSGVTSKSVTKKTKKIKTQAQRRRQRHENSTTSCSSKMSGVPSEDLPDDDFMPDDPKYEDDLPTASISEHESLNAGRSEDDLPIASILELRHKSNLKDILQVDDHVLVKWSDQIYPGKLLSLNEEGVMVGAMKKGVKFWRWPLIKDEQLYSWEDVLRKINPPKLVKKVAFLCQKSITLIRVLPLCSVVC